MASSKRGKAITLHIYDIRLSLASNHELSDKRLAALAGRFQMLLRNLNYELLAGDDAPLRIENHWTEELDSGC